MGNNNANGMALMVKLYNAIYILKYTLKFLTDNPSKVGAWR